MKTIFHIYSETLLTKVQKMMVIITIAVSLFGLAKDSAY